MHAVFKPVVQQGGEHFFYVAHHAIANNYLQVVEQQPGSRKYLSFAMPGSWFTHNYFGVILVTG